MLTEARSRKARLIEAAGRFTLMVERVTPIWARAELAAIADHLISIDDGAAAL